MYAVSVVPLLTSCCASPASTGFLALYLPQNIKTPSLTIYLARDASDNIHAKDVQSALEYTTLATVTAATEIYYDPDPTGTVIEEDRDFVESYFEMPDEELDTTRMSPWLLRIELDREMIVDKKLVMADVAEKINSEFEDDLTCIFNDDNAAKNILRIRVMESEPVGGKGDREDESREEDENVFLRQIEANMLTQLQLKGIQGISKVGNSALPVQWLICQLICSNRHWWGLVPAA